MKVLICGGRDFKDRDLLFSTMRELNKTHKFTTVISGAASGADDIGEQWGHWAELDVDMYPARWDTHGRSAGPIRNKQMLDEGKPDLVVAFAGGKGTANMIKQAKANGVEVMEIA